MAYGATRIGNTNIAIDGNTINAANVNGNVTLIPNGTGKTILSGIALAGDADGDADHTINGTVVASALEIHTSGGTSMGGLSSHRLATSATLGAHIIGYKGRGATGAPLVVVNGDAVTRLVSAAFDGTDYELNAEIRMSVDGVPGNDDMPGRIGFFTTADGGVTPIEALRIDSSQNVDVLTSLVLSNLTATTVPYLGASKEMLSSAVTPTELGYVGGVTSAIQTQIDNIAVDWAVAAKTTTYTVTTSDYFLTGDTSGGAFSFTLPTAVGITGQVFVFKYIDTGFANALTIDGNGSETVGGSTTTTLDTLNESLRIVSDGANWIIVERVIPSVWTDYTPGCVWSGTMSTNEAGWKRVGDSIIVRYSGTLNAAPTGNFAFDIPSGLTFDTAKMLDKYNYSTIKYGDWSGNGASTGYFGIMVYLDTNTLSGKYFDTSGTYQTPYNVSPTAPPTWASADEIFAISFPIPITGWNN